MDIIIVDDNKIFLEGLSLFLTSKLGYNISGQFDSSKEFIKWPEVYKADCILIDIEMPELNGIQTVKLLLQENSNLKFIAITNHTEIAYLEELIKSGFKGCVFKNTLYKELPDVLNKVRNGGFAFPANIKI